MSTPIYRVSQEFLRIEAIGSRGARSGDPADPLSVEVRVTDSNDITKVIEDAFSTNSQDQQRLYRVQTGLWVFQLNAPLYGPGKAYTVNFRYSMTPSNINVVRKNFIWQPILPVPRVLTNCIIYGLLADTAGIPVSGQRLMVEEYKNFVTLNHRVSQNTVESDSFGLWSIEVPRGKIIRVLFGDLAKVIQVPDSDRVALSDIPEYQPQAKQRDAFGYPLPGGA